MGGCIMLTFLRLLIKTLLIVIVSIIVGRIFLLILHRVPGVIVALSTISIGVFSVAFYKGSFSAVGLHTKKSIKISLIISIILFILSTAILIFVQ
jgi:hypothetical protein